MKSPIDVQHPGLPPEWHCPHCNYGEYKNRDDWPARAAQHIAQCPSAPAPYVPFLVGEFAPEKKERCPFTDDEGRCIRRKGHDGPCKMPPEPICTCGVDYEHAPYPCAVHEAPKLVSARKRFKTIGPPTEADLERIEREETRRFNSDQLDKYLVALGPKHD